MNTLSLMPKEMTGPAAWVGSHMQAATDLWVHHLSLLEITALENAARIFLDTDKDIGEMTADAFAAPAMHATLHRLRRALLDQHGFMVLRGLPVDRYDRQTSAAIFCGIGAHLGAARSQNALGHVLGHVRDLGANPQDATTRIYQTAARQSFHTDSADIVGLLCLQTAQAGGDSLLVSAETIFNRMRAECPNLLARLFDPIATDRRGEVPPGMAPFMTIPPFSWYDGKLTVFYQRQYIDSAQRFSDAMRLTEEHVAALDTFDALANDPNLHVKMRLEPGDMQFVYNHSQLHDRTGFTDWPDPARRRHLLRLWISPSQDRALPECFRQRYGCLTPGRRGGIVTAATRLHAPLD